MKKKTNLFILILYLICSIGCTSDDDELLYLTKAQNIEALSTRTMAITVCVDAYVEVGGYSEYKGTTCETYYGGAGGGGSTPSGGYDPGGFPQHGIFEDHGSGGSSGVQSYYVGDKWKFYFPKVQKIYDTQSTLNVTQKSDLEYVLELFYIFPSDFLKMYNKLLAKNIRFKFSVDPSIEANAQYNGQDNSIKFKYEGNISWTYLIEEIVHAVQKNCYYENTMNDKYKNYEFEAKVFIDLVNGIGGESESIDVMVEYRPRLTDMSEPFYSEYYKWINKIIDQGVMAGSDYDTFNSFCNSWNPPKGEYAPDFVPELIQEFFRKPRPPMPLP